MQVIHTIQEIRAALKPLQAQGKSVGFVPTMGALHEGHLSLIRRAREENDYVFVSAFVNPTQFGPSEDLENYPRTLDQDTDACQKEGVDFIFAPRSAEMYPTGYATYVLQERYTEPFEGEIRTGHFHGVCTVCTKLFNIVQPTRAYFGQKDYQQGLVIRRMVQDMNIDLEIIMCPIVRESDGLAMSSRNAYLPEEQRAQATCLSKALAKCSEMFADGERSVAPLIAAMRQVIDDAPLARLDYLAIVSPDSLREIRRIESEAVVLVAARLGGTRLLDNSILKVE
jgi:pantoate--beta-alanine ligase